jgi:hypothetical protein
MKTHMVRVHPSAANLNLRLFRTDPTRVTPNP